MHVRTLTAAVLVGVALVASACGARHPVFVDEGGVYDAESAIELLEGSDAAELADAPSEDAERLRTAALARLRGQGEKGGAAAKAITLAFSDSPRGVPYYIESASFEGEPCWIVLEATGRPGGSLSQRRLWVMEQTGRIRFFAAR